MTIDRNSVSLPAAQLAKHAVVQAYESRDEYVFDVVSNDDEISDWSLYDAHKNIKDVDEVTTDTRHGPSFEDALDDNEELDGLYVYCKQTGYVSERTNRGDRWNPPAYKNHDVTIHVEAWWFPRPDELAPLTGLSIDAKGGRPTPPDPEPYDERL